MDQCNVAKADPSPGLAKGLRMLDPHSAPIDTSELFSANMSKRGGKKNKTFSDKFSRHFRFYIFFKKSHKKRGRGDPKILFFCDLKPMQYLRTLR
jgi:hypothetical protein